MKSPARLQVFRHVGYLLKYTLDRIPRFILAMLLAPTPKPEAKAKTPEAKKKPKKK